MKPWLNLGTAGSIASVVSLAVGFAGGAWWRRLQTLVARDREAAEGLLGLFGIYRHLQRAETAMGAALKERLTGRRVALTNETLFEIQGARDGVLKAEQALNTYFWFFRDLKIAGTDPLVRAARVYRARGPLTYAVICYEQALELSDDGRTLCLEDRRLCVQGLQYCAVVLGEREEAQRWAREARARGVDGCIAEEELVKWFVVYRWAFLLRLVIPSRSRWRAVAKDRSKTIGKPRP